MIRAEMTLIARITRAVKRCANFATKKLSEKTHAKIATKSPSTIKLLLSFCEKISPTLAQKAMMKGFKRLSAKPLAKLLIRLSFATLCAAFCLNSSAFALLLSIENAIKLKNAKPQAAMICVRISLLKKRKSPKSKKIKNKISTLIAPKPKAKAFLKERNAVLKISTFKGPKGTATPNPSKMPCKKLSIIVFVLKIFVNCIRFL